LLPEEIEHVIVTTIGRWSEKFMSGSKIAKSDVSTLPTSTNHRHEHWNNTNLPPVLPHPAVLVGDFNSHHPDWGYQEADLNGESLQEWALKNDYLLLHDPKQRDTLHSARWQRNYSPDFCWISTTVGRSQPASSVVLGDFPHSQHRSSVIHIGLQLPIIRGVDRKRWNFRKADWARYTLATKRSIPLIPVNNISVEESYQRFCGAMQKAARHSISRGFRPTYTPCLDEECQDLLKQYEESGDPDVADHLIESHQFRSRKCIELIVGFNDNSRSLYEIPLIWMNIWYCFGRASGPK